MRKIFGILFLILGIVMLVVGGAIIVTNEAKDDTVSGQIKEEFSKQYQTERERELNNGRILLVAGLIFFVSGTTIISVKTKGQKKKENDSYTSEDWNTAPLAQNNDILTQLERLGELKAKGILSEEEFQQQKKKILG
ncbi:SHOCT domain-containing protein [Flavobacterium sp.]|uniref:SHOCT domain-containing protein n=1 Tax=Flavobacterium sp. TaxID=239 RepID=UPI002FD88A5D